MADINEIVKVAVDAYHGNVEKYSVGQSQDLLRQALVEANGGSTILNYKNIRDGKCNGLFALIEEILSKTVVEGLQGDEFFNAFVDFRNVAEGDKNVFVVNDNNLFVVAKAADGTQGIRRQRLGGATETQIPTELRIVRIYEELNRVLSGRVDFNEMITKVAESFKQQLLNDIYGLWNSAATASALGSTYAISGSYDEDDLIDLVSHVEAAANGMTATILGTKKALRNLAPSIQGTDSKSDLYNMGYYGKFYGANVVAIPQRHAVGTTNFLMPDDVITVIAGDDKPIKVVYEGDPIVLLGDPMTNADFTQEYLYGEKYGLGIVLAGNHGLGRYELSSST